MQISSKITKLPALEQKFGKKEEQLKIKKAMPNEDMKEKNPKIMDRLNKAGIRSN